MLTCNVETLNQDYMLGKYYDFAWKIDTRKSLQAGHHARSDKEEAELMNIETLKK